MKQPFVVPRERWVLENAQRYETRRLQYPARYVTTPHDTLADALAAARADPRAGLYAVARHPTGEDWCVFMSPEWCAVGDNGMPVYPTATRNPIKRSA